MPSSKFLRTRHGKQTFKPCLPTIVRPRKAQTPAHPATVVGRAYWRDLNATPPGALQMGMTLAEITSPQGWSGTRRVCEYRFTVNIERQPGGDLYDVFFWVWWNGWSDDDSWHDLTWPWEICHFDTEWLTHVYEADIDENSVRFGAHGIF